MGSISFPLPFPNLTTTSTVYIKYRRYLHPVDNIPKGSSSGRKYMKQKTFVLVVIN